MRDGFLSPLPSFLFFNKNLSFSGHIKRQILIFFLLKN